MASSSCPKDFKVTTLWADDALPKRIAKDNTNKNLFICL
jgi:hypothetical protein